MFKSKITNNTKTSALVKGETTLLAANVEFKGDISFTGNLEIEGRVLGNVHSEKGPSRVRVQSKGVVEGDISGAVIIVNGTVKGNLNAREHLELAANAVVHGDVLYQSIEMIRGAKVKGRLLPMRETSPNVAKSPGADATEAKSTAREAHTAASVEHAKKAAPNPLVTKSSKSVSA